MYSLFEPRTEWTQKGKQRPNVELGHRLLIATDQHQLIQNYDETAGVAGVNRSVPVADRLLERYGAGSLASLSFDKGFTRAEDLNLLSLYVPTLQTGLQHACNLIAAPAVLWRWSRLTPSPQWPLGREQGGTGLLDTISPTVDELPSPVQDWHSDR